MSKLAATTAEDVSKYRDFQFGDGPATVVKLAGMNPPDARLIHSRPSVMRELAWRDSEPAKEFVSGRQHGSGAT